MQLLRAMQAAVAEVEDAVKFAQAAPYPDLSVGASGVYAPLDEEG